MTKKNTYTAPEVELLDIKLENAFASQAVTISKYQEETLELN